MKRKILILTAFISLLLQVSAQNSDDALRYSQIFWNGSARFNAMGGAFTALGGDLSSISLNPAGIGVFRRSEISLSPQLYNFNVNTKFNGTSAADELNEFNLGQGGVVLNLRNSESTTGLVGLNFGYSFNRTNNYNQSIRIEGTSDVSSLLDYWAENSEGIVDTMLYWYAPEAFLGWYTWLLGPRPGVDDSFGTAYTNYGRYNANYGKNMTRVLTTTGSTNEHNISLGGNFSNKFYLGATVAITQLDYESRMEHSESSDSVLASGFRDFSYAYYYRNSGTGYSLKLGAIYRPIEALRFGFTIHSPTYYTITEYLADNITSDVEGKNEDFFENNASWFKYHLLTPFRFSVGAAWQFRKFALLSLDYEFVDYGMASFSTVKDDDYNYTEKNDAIKSTLKSASNIRAGAEFRLNRLYLRGGYSYYGKAYKDGDIGSIIDYNSISAGAGFREQNIYIDFSYSRVSNPQRYIFYETAAETPLSSMDISRNIFTVSFGYKFGY